jgi:hypothetical protein
MGDGSGLYRLALATLATANPVGGRLSSCDAITRSISPYSHACVIVTESSPALPLAALAASFVAVLA